MRWLARHLESPAGVARVRRFFYAGLAALALVEIAAPAVLYPERGHFGFEDLPAFGSLYGLVACVVIVVASKVLGKLWLVRRETYYDP